MLNGLHVILLRVVDVERERRFYQEVFDLELLAEPYVPGTLAHLRIPGIGYPEGSPYSGTIEIIAGGALHDAPADRKLSATTPVFQVSDVNACLSRAIKAGGTLVNNPWDSERREADDPAANGVRLAYFADPEGHVIGMRCPLRDS